MKIDEVNRIKIERDYHLPMRIEDVKKLILDGESNILHRETTKESVYIIFMLGFMFKNNKEMFSFLTKSSKDMIAFRDELLTRANKFRDSNGEELEEMFDRFGEHIGDRKAENVEFANFILEHITVENEIGYLVACFVVGYLCASMVKQ